MVCAALALSLATSQAQVYSANVVGYVNATISPGNFIALGNTLINGNDANATNNNINACLGAGLISDPNIATPGQNPAYGSNSVLYTWNSSLPIPAFNGALYYFNAADATSWEGSASPAGWYDQGGTYFPNVVLPQGSAAFVQNSTYSPVSMTTTILGQVLQGTNQVTIAQGYNFISLFVPIGGTNPVAPPFGLPLTMTSTNLEHIGDVTPTPFYNDTIYTWNATLPIPSFNGGYYYFNEADATFWEGFASPAGFYDAGGSPMPSSLYPAVNQGFFLYHTTNSITPGSILWTNSFKVE